MWQEVFEMTQPIPRERMLEHVVVVRIFRVDAQIVDVPVARIQERFAEVS